MYLGPCMAGSTTTKFSIFVNTHYSALCPVLSTCTTCEYCTTRQCLLADSVLQSPNQNGIYIKLHTIFRYSAVPRACCAHGRTSFAFSSSRDRRWAETWPSCMLCTCTHLLASTLYMHTKNLDDGLKPVVTKWSLALNA